MLRFQLRTCKMKYSCSDFQTSVPLERGLSDFIYIYSLLHPLCFHHQLQMGEYYNGLGLSHSEQITVGEIFLVQTRYSVTHEKVFLIAVNCQNHLVERLMLCEIHHCDCPHKKQPSCTSNTI